MTGISYSDLTTQLTDLLEYPLVSASSATPSSDSNFNNILPAIIADAEQRIYREVDFLAVREENSTLPVTVSSRNFTIPAEIIVVESLSLIVPGAGTAANVGTRVSLLRVSVDALNMLWPQEAITSPPVQNQSYYAMLSNTQALIAPTPDKAYTAEVVGPFRPAPMSATNTTTYLASQFPDMFLAACMVFGSAFQRDFVGGASENPAMGINWESHYTSLRQSVIDEEKRRRGLQVEDGSGSVQGNK